MEPHNYTKYDLVQCRAVRMNPSSFGSLPSSACSLGPSGSQGLDRITRFDYTTSSRQVTKEYRGYRTALQQVYKTNHYESSGNTAGRLTGVTNANGNYTEYRYDSHNRLARQVYPSKSQAGALNESDYRHFWYDGNGNRIKERKRDGRVILYSFDRLNRRTLKDLPNTSAKDVYYRYNLQGLETQARFGSHSGAGITTQYTGFGNISSETVNLDGTTRTVQYLQDHRGNRSQIRHPDGVTFQYDYDGLDRLARVRQGSATLLSYAYNPFGRLDQFDTSGGAATDLSYDGISRLASLGHQFYGSTYDLTLSFGYNAASQVVEQTFSNERYHSDASSATTGNYQVNGVNQYTAIDGKSISHDANGNLTADGENTYSYDVENRLTSVSGAHSASLSYDPKGRLYKINPASGTATNFLYSGDSVIAEYQNGNITQRYVHHDSRGLAPQVSYQGLGTSTSNRRFLHTNHQGSVIALSNNSASVTNVNRYDEYGVPSGSNQGRFGYTGQMWLPEVGLYHYRARVYKPEIGRFLQTDPIGYEDQMNLYAYVANDPINLTDPTGLEIYNPDEHEVDSESMGSLETLDENTEGVDYTITSGVRTKEHNKAVGGASGSHHVDENGGTGVDVNPTIGEDAPEGTTTESIAEQASEAGFTGIITYKKEDGTSNNGNGGRLHLDRRSGKYHAKAKKNSNGKTYYEPTNYGK